MTDPHATDSAVTGLPAKDTGPAGTDAVVLAPAVADASSQDPNWWRQAVIYQVYPRSFADSDGDGIGDLPGLTGRLTHLASLGVDALWLSPFYPSELADGGYDVADFRDVDPRLGTLADFDAMVAEAHRLGLKILVDLVPNHTSDQHVWFQEALASPPGSAARARYVFRDGRGENGELPPSDWVSRFGGSAWKRVPDGQWYLHLFAPEQPDLDWTNEEVREDFRRTLRFWSDRGVDGFRIDVAHGLAKDLTEPLRDMGDNQFKGDHDLMPDGTHPHWDRDEVHEIYRDWRIVLDSYDPPRMAVAEAWVKNSRRVLYTRPDELGQAFNFEYLQAEWTAPALRKVITESLATAAAAGASATWVLSNHDVVRHASRLALPLGTDTDAWLLSDGKDPAPDLESGLRRARAATLLMLALPGASYVYQGEELGLPEVADLPAEALQDPVWENTGHTRKGRDGCRVPLPWTRGGTSYGFGPGGAWLPQPPVFGELSVAAQDGVEGSTLELYRAALRLRRELQGDESLEWLSAPDETAAEGPAADGAVADRTSEGGAAGGAAADGAAGTGTGTADLIHFRRSTGWQCLANLSDRPVSLPAGEVLLASGPLTGGQLPPDTTVWLRAAR